MNRSLGFNVTSDHLSNGGSKVANGSAGKSAKSKVRSKKTKAIDSYPPNHGVKFQDIPTGLTKDVTLSVDPNRHNLGRRATVCERLLGIVPGQFNFGGASVPFSDGSSDDKRIMVQGLLPGGEAIKSGIKIGQCCI